MICLEYLYTPMRSAHLTGMPHLDRFMCMIRSSVSTYRDVALAEKVKTSLWVIVAFKGLLVGARPGLK